MKIGEFAKICNTRISVLRHYDKLNLLKPVYIDEFTGYRYYSKQQIPIFFRITALKQAGFSLHEIATLLSNIKGDADILDIFEKKRSELLDTLHNLDEAKEMIMGVNTMMNLIFNENEKTTVARYLCMQAVGEAGVANIAEVTADRNDITLEALCKEMDETISAKDYQRISAFTINGQEISCQVVKLQEEMIKLQENTALPFVNDEAAIGKWEAVGEFVVKEEFFAQKECRENWYYEFPRVLYFLPEGEKYWCYGWTKGKLIIENGQTSSVNDCEIEEVDGERYMFISFKTYDYCRGGKPKILVLRQLDNQHYSAVSLARKDDINMPFVPDEKVIGKWKVFDFLLSKEEFSAEGSGEPPIFFKEIEFFEGGSCTSIYGEEIISGDDKQTWTKGYVLRKWNSCACAYEIRTVDSKDYLIMEWKSGDYRWGGFPTDYYVFVRE